MSATSPRSAAPALSRNVVIAGSVVVFHVAALWALQQGLIQRAIEIIVPVEMLSQIIEPPKPTPPPPPPPPAPPVPVKQPVVKLKTPTLPPPPQPQAIADPTPAPNAPTGVTTPPAPLPPIETPVAVTPAPPPPPPAPPKVELPSSDAAYLQNPTPTYPQISKRLNEQGKVVVRVLINASGVPERTEIKRSSGFERLDRAAVEYVMKCRYVAGKVNGVAQAMWYDAPVNYQLD